MRAARFARDAHPERTPGEVVERREITAAGAYAPASWEELDCPDEIELELAEQAAEWTGFEFYIALTAAGMSRDMMEPHESESEPVVDPWPYTTKQAEDCWYAGVPRGRRLVLRKL